MNAFCRRTFYFGWVMVAVLVSPLVSTSASASYTQEQEQACTGDAFRLCGSFIPDVDRITACMIQKKAQLSPGCRRFFRPEPAARKPARAKKPKKPA